MKIYSDMCEYVPACEQIFVQSMQSVSRHFSKAMLQGPLIIIEE